MSKLFLTVGVLAVIAVVVGTFAISRQNNETQTNSKPTESYVAMGDSVAAGVGLPTYSDASACDRTKESYPAILASQNNYSVTNLACSKATIQAGVNGPQTVNNLALDSQVDQLFKLEKTPDVITLTIGANDIQWTRFLACYTTECASSITDDLAGPLQQLQSNLSSVLERMKQHYTEKSPTVVVTGYYGLLPDNTPETCSDANGLDATEQRSIKQLFTSLNDTLRNATEQSNYALFAPISLKGHELCTADSWIQGAADKVPFHPNQDGQKSIATQVAGVIQISSTKGD